MYRHVTTDCGFLDLRLMHGNCVHNRVMHIHVMHRHVVHGHVMRTHVVYRHVMYSHVMHRCAVYMHVMHRHVMHNRAMHRRAMHRQVMHRYAVHTYAHFTKQPGWLRLERAVAGAAARAEHNTVAGTLLHFGVCCELAVCRLRVLKWAPSRLPECQKCRVSECSAVLF